MDQKSRHIHTCTHILFQKICLYFIPNGEKIVLGKTRNLTTLTQLIVTDFDVTEINTFCIKLQSFIIIIHKHSRSLHSLEPEEWRELVIIVCSWFSFTENIFNTALIKKAE